VDLATHVVTSLALARGFFPRRSWHFAVGVVLAGTLADADLLTLFFGPDAYLSGRFTVTHSLVGTVIVIAAAAAFLLAVRQKGSPPQKPGPAPAPRFSSILLAASLAAIVHLLMDLATSSGVALLWPFRATRFAWDCLPFVDPWILALLLAGIFLPELFRLISSEIGAKQKSPRGRNVPLAALALVVFYVGARATLHNTAATQLDAHSYRGASPRQVAAFPDSFSPVIWHGVVETTLQICIVDIPGASARFDPENAACVHKPEDSAALAAAQKTQAAQSFLRAARFPKASVGATADGSEVVLRDMRNAAQNETRYALAARILLDRNAQVTSQSIVWARHLKLR
jgi:membrane-bound metal-dependent hydrolase YbcI (DUF457 family)